ncbi:ABC transporter substrate-binding protein [Hahella sp. CCB-MM4]|uniref:substrate-binding periplasmic protein n=1 Tax=Hahella sp. (strain CCB-MM4) TaxID=1926491 RepID=UPI000B9B0631|nr:transporter substrate-binding domain-containing protein [Hahella sp. CCB-MM4]
MNKPSRPGSKAALIASVMLLVMASIGKPRAEQPLLHILAYHQPPYMEQKNNKPVGLAIDILNSLLMRANINYDLAFHPPKRAYQYTRFHIDHCVLAIERSQEREAQFLWVSPILVTRHAFYSRPSRNGVIRSIDDAKNLRIGSYLGSGAGEYLEHYGFKVELTTSNDLNIKKLIRKRLDLWASDTISADILIRENGLSLRRELVFLTTLRALACNKGTSPDLVKRMQSELKEMYRNGVISEIYSSYIDKKNENWLLYK